jgi:hypothetical protein
MPSYYVNDFDDDYDYDLYVPPTVVSSARGRPATRTVRPLAGTSIATGVTNSTIRHRSLTPSRPVTVARRHYSVDDDFEVTTPNYTNLRAKYTEAKNKMDTHKTLLDKYLPIYLGPENAVEIEVDYKFGELCNRMPRLDPYRPAMSNGNSVSTNKPPRARLPNNFETKKSTQPAMSDTRKRVRDVICKTRNDKHYYS